MQEQQQEYLTNPSNDRLILFPIRDHKCWQMYKDHVAAIWHAEELTELQEDAKDWKSLNEGEKHYIKHILAFFASIDSIVNENLAQRFYNEVQIPEARAFYSFQMFIESVHSECYQLLIDNLIQDPYEKLQVFRAIETMPIIQKKANWVQSWIKSDRSFAERLFTFSVIEGVLFQAAFCSIFWLKSRNKLIHGLGMSNDLIARDEAMHSEFGQYLYSMLTHKLSTERIHQILDEAVQLEMEFVTKSLPVDLIGMNCEQMCEYVKFVADRHIKVMGYPVLYNATNPFQFMCVIGLEQRNNFFEHGSTNYQKMGVKKKDNYIFTTDEPF